MMGKMLILVAALAGCAGATREARTVHFQATGLSAPMLALGTGERLTFVNEDARPHQVYSPDCAALSSTPLRPGEEFTAVVPAGRQVCHFQDLLDPLAPAYSGAVKVDQSSQDWVSANVTP